ncbi:MAG: hypothetical protein COW54_07565 [Rhodobacteraceae bacterium CG17_big_fil_post_rev_8_21_14_2_50_63_15]|nr:MAG: hypothetical protein COW54_07565 [Rhodobacteraceae bacterium CG17_big_fil_post_rev_8_21_14_2_50_63_15]
MPLLRCINAPNCAHGRNRSNVWQFPGATGGKVDDDDDFRSHPTVKTLKLIEEALLDVTGVSDIVLDPFLERLSLSLNRKEIPKLCLV